MDKDGVTQALQRAIPEPEEWTVIRAKAAVYRARAMEIVKGDAIPGRNALSLAADLLVVAQALDAQSSALRDQAMNERLMR